MMRSTQQPSLFLTQTEHDCNDLFEGMEKVESQERQSDPVTAAVVSGQFEDVQGAVEAGYDVNQRDDQKRAPLFTAVEVERLDICQCLVELVEQLSIRIEVLTVTLLYTLLYREETREIVKYLLSKEASKNSL
ncbi:hypothetical protein KIN20_029088 [Parelaphostrongylus tenuis]|uniref:Uncharacterized protein n=1 Tax=Parelaphostrongylus tenuis TaxID=148309 RepID=A0AAD5R1R8_PARTN|nr:hypothetical protein KIN20_029088 [Parelaphostrongylus tenuis]